ncbi:MAG TPA: hypothetical protein DDZ68_12855 [Parvularcula sp.]|nr:hypothetical protein [Parvularcula sp.]
MKHFTDFLRSLVPGWPTERQWVTIGVFALTMFLLGMAHASPFLWKVELFKFVLQAVVVTGLINMILAFHFAANKSDEVKADNTGKAFDAIAAASRHARPDAENDTSKGDTK